MWSNEEVLLLLSRLTVETRIPLTAETILNQVTAMSAQNLASLKNRDVAQLRVAERAGDQAAIDPETGSRMKRMFEKHLYLLRNHWSFDQSLIAPTNRPD